MCFNKKGLGDLSEEETDIEDMENNDSSDSDVSMTDSDSDAKDEETTIEESGNESKIEEEEEDETIKAIRRENERERDHPPALDCEDFIVDLSFHPHEDILGVALMNGDVALYKYTNEENTLAQTLELHEKACRDIEFSADGKILFSTSRDKTVMLSDVESTKLIRFYENAHDYPVYRIYILDENLFVTGDENGEVKLWDLREKSNEKPIFRIKKNEDYISDIITNESKQHLLCSSGDGSLTTIDLQKRQFFMQSEDYNEELTCLGLFRSETKLLASSSKGKLMLYNWGEFGLHSDLFPGPKVCINALIPITENIVVTACEDGVLRATHLFPHRHLGIVGQHSLSVEHVDICNNGQFIATSSHNNDIKFWNIQYFEEFEAVSKKHNKHNKKKELEHNLPSSKFKNVADFFSDLA